MNAFITWLAVSTVLGILATICGFITKDAWTKWRSEVTAKEQQKVVTESLGQEERKPEVPNDSAASIKQEIRGDGNKSYQAGRDMIFNGPTQEELAKALSDAMDQRDLRLKERVKQQYATSRKRFKELYPLGFSIFGITKEDKIVQIGETDDEGLKLDWGRASAKPDGDNIVLSLPRMVDANGNSYNHTFKIPRKRIEQGPIVVFRAGNEQVVVEMTEAEEGSTIIVLGARPRPFDLRATRTVIVPGGMDGSSGLILFVRLTNLWTATPLKNWRVALNFPGNKTIRSQAYATAPRPATKLKDEALSSDNYIASKFSLSSLEPGAPVAGWIYFPLLSVDVDHAKSAKNVTLEFDYNKGTEALSVPLSIVSDAAKANIAFSDIEISFVPVDDTGTSIKFSATAVNKGSATKISRWLLTTTLPSGKNFVSRAYRGATPVMGEEVDKHGPSGPDTPANMFQLMDLPAQVPKRGWVTFAGVDLPMSSLVPRTIFHFEYETSEGKVGFIEYASDEPARSIKLE